jgi:hypothetical protein
LCARVNINNLLGPFARRPFFDLLDTLKRLNNDDMMGVVKKSAAKHQRKKKIVFNKRRENRKIKMIKRFSPLEKVSHRIRSMNTQNDRRKKEEKKNLGADRKKKDVCTDTQVKRCIV